MLGHKRIPSREGGIEVVVQELSTRMVQKGHSVVCYNRSGHHISGHDFDSERMTSFMNVTLKYVFTINKKGLAAMSSSFFSSIAAAFGKYDVVHFHAEGTCAMIWLPKLMGKKCIVTIHGLDHQRAKWGNFAKKYILFGEKQAVKYADDIIVLSQGVKNYFKDHYGIDTNFIPNGVNKPEKKLPDIIYNNYSIKENEYVLYLGRIVPEKGIQYLIQAYKKINTEKKLIIAGGSSDTDDFLNELKQLAADDPRIIFTGFVQGKILEELYSNAYIYTLPSDLEGMPLSLLEAMSYGNCCLVSDIDECSEVVKDKAVLFRKSDVNDLSKKLQMLCDNPDLVQKYKDNASEYVCKKYNWDDIVDKTLELYNR